MHLDSSGVCGGSVRSKFVQTKLFICGWWQSISHKPNLNLVEVTNMIDDWWSPSLHATLKLEQLERQPWRASTTTPPSLDNDNGSSNNGTTTGNNDDGGNNGELEMHLHLEPLASPVCFIIITFFPTNSLLKFIKNVNNNHEQLPRVLDVSNDCHHSTSTCLTTQATLTRPMTKTRQTAAAASVAAWVMRLYDDNRWPPLRH